MKTIKIIFPILILVMFTMLTKQVSAKNYNTIYMDSVKTMDTISICNSLDTIEIAPMKGQTNSMWVYSNRMDTSYQDTLYLNGSFSGLLTYRGFDSVSGFDFSVVYFSALSLKGNNTSISCGDTAKLAVTSNYKGSGVPVYNWLPTTGLSDPTIANPVAIIKNSVTYTISITTLGGCTATATVKVTLNQINSPNICIVSIDSTDKNSIYWENPVSAAIDSFYVYRESNVTNAYNKIGAVNYNNAGIFIDTASFPDIQSNKYELSIKDACGFESAKSTPHKTMHLSIDQGQNNSWNLIWEPYEGFDVSTYYIYRGTSSTNLQQIGSTSASSTQFTDVTAPSGLLFYQIAVVSPNNCIISNTNIKSDEISINTSVSNIASNNVTGINQIANKPEFSIYPNPTHDNVFIVSNRNDIKKGIVEIITLEGTLLQSVEMNSSKVALNMSNLENGFYVIKIKTDSGITIMDLVKE